MKITDCKTVGAIDKFLQAHSSHNVTLEMLDAYSNRRMWFGSDEGPDGEERVSLYIDEDDPDESDMPVHRSIECEAGWKTAISVELKKENDNVYYTLVIGYINDVKVSFAEVKWNLEL